MSHFVIVAGVRAEEYVELGATCQSRLGGEGYRGWIN